MGKPKKNKFSFGRKPKQAGRHGKNTFKTKSGQTIKINRSLGERIKARRALRAEKRAKRLAGMPKSRIKRFFFRLHPKRMYKYWFSREGGIMALKLSGIGIIAVFLLLVGIFAYFRKDLPNLRDISGNELGGSIRYYDRTGETLLWEDFDAVKRNPVGGENISQYMKDATLAIEDQEFFNHNGFDMRGITRAAVNNVVGGDTRQGGSTITQQLVRLTQSNVGMEQTYTRKLKELILAVELERSFTKEEILAGYLDTAPYGNIQYGVETAAQDYFQKSAKDLTLDEAAFLAAIPKSPSYYSPYGPDFNPEALVGRMLYVLDQMYQLGMITKEERDEAQQVNILAKYNEPKPRYENITAPWFVLAAKESLERKYSEDTVRRGGWRVTTTLDLNLQRIAEEKVQQGLPQVIRQGGDSVGFAAEDVETGQVVALVGGADFTNETYGQNNYARLKLPPGSSFKPYDYLSLIEHTDNFGAGSVLFDTQGPLDGYPCTNRSRPPTGNCLQNYDFRYPGPVTLRYALGGSRNVPAVKAMLIAGIDTTIQTAEILMAPDPEAPEEIIADGYNCYEDEGLTIKTQCYASSAIGDGAYLRLDEHVHGYATISRHGKNIPQTYFLEITDAGNKTVFEWQPTNGKQVVKEESAYIVADMLEDPRASYMSRKPHRFNGWNFGLKTGTTNDSKDGWLAGFSTKYAAGVWVGAHNRQVEMRGFMENMTQPIWQGWMEEAHRNLEPVNRERPEGIQTLNAFVIRSPVGVAAVVPSTATDIFPSWFEQQRRGESRTIDIVSNKLATECTPARARKEVSGSDPTAFSGDTFVTNAANLEAKDDVHQCSDIKPSISVSATPQGNAYLIGATISQGTHPISSDRFRGTVNFKIDGQIIRSIEVGGPGPIQSFTYKPDFTGSKSLTAEIIDSVLYDGTGSVTIRALSSNTSSGGSTQQPITLTQAAYNGAVTEFTWSGSNGSATVYDSGGTALCSGNGNCTYAGDLSGTQVYVQGSGNRKSATVTVTGP
jgi:membrane peptidoglycan carboxypeptidase